MITLGHFALFLALGCAIIQMVLSFLGSYTKDLRTITLGIRASQILFLLSSLSFLTLIYGFLTNDFTVKYIATNSNVYLPWYYKVSATWAGHEGSLLLWAWILSLWIFIVSIKTDEIPPNFKSKIFGVLGVIATGFISFVLFTSNPFTRLLPGFPLIGRDLNPLLQDIGLILHPPLLYMGYVGFSVSFAFIVAALMEGQLNTVWARWARPWVSSAWGFLTIGIALGSWWAYYELGWGGWWFWDPVENASLMPWIAGSALIHSLAATEKRNVFKIWTSFLAITTFSLSLIGTFLVRSGVLTSVHAFASDPTRGSYILMLIVIISGGAFLTLVLRAHRLKSSSRYSFVSKETGILINNLILSFACLIVMIGTLSPLLYEVLGLRSISIGAPYFNAWMKPVLFLLLFFLCFSPFLNWKKDHLSQYKIILPIFLIISTVISYFINASFEDIRLISVLLTALAITATLMALYDFYHHRRHKKAFKLPSKSYIAMTVAHLGFLITCIGIILASSYSIEDDFYVKKNDSVTVRGISFQMKDSKQSQTKLYQSTTIDFAIFDQNHQQIATLSPEKRIYQSSMMPMAESALLPSFTQDIYIALGEPQTNEAWSVRFQIKPYIRWIWFGAIIMGLSVFFVISDKRYKIKINSK